MKISDAMDRVKNIVVHRIVTRGNSKVKYWYINCNQRDYKQPRLCQYYEWHMDINKTEENSRLYLKSYL